MRDRTSPLALFAAALLLSGCSGRPSVFSPGGPAARSIGNLGAWVVIVLSVVAAVMMVLILVAAGRRRGTLEEHEPVGVGGGQTWILVGGFGVPVVILFAIFASSLVTESRFPLHDGQHYKPDIRIIARQWWWEVKYTGDGPDQQVTTANEIHIPTNWPVEIELESRDVIHSFWVPSLHGKVDVVPGRENHIRLVADTPGRYQGMCAEYCGTQHTNMGFVIVAEPLEQYEKWRAHQAEPALAEADPMAAHGKQIFETKACGLCHTIRGTRAMADVGPDLTHLASRSAIAANSFPNSRAWLEAWVTHAQSLKPGNQMPDLAEMRGDELQAVAHYLESLQ